MFRFQPLDSTEWEGLPLIHYESNSACSCDNALRSEQIDLDILIVIRRLHTCISYIEFMTLTTIFSYLQTPQASSGTITNLNKIFDSYRGT